MTFKGERGNCQMLLTAETKQTKRTIGWGRVDWRMSSAMTFGVVLWDWLVGKLVARPGKGEELKKKKFCSNQGLLTVKPGNLGDKIRDIWWRNHEKMAKTRKTVSINLTTKQAKVAIALRENSQSWPNLHPRKTSSSITSLNHRTNPAIRNFSEV